MALNINLEVLLDTFVAGSTSITLTLSGNHTSIPRITAIGKSGTNANYNVFVESVTHTQVVIGISSPAPPDLKVHVTAISNL